MISRRRSYPEKSLKYCPPVLLPWSRDWACMIQTSWNVQTLRNLTHKCVKSEKFSREIGSFAIPTKSSNVLKKKNAVWKANTTSQTQKWVRWREVHRWNLIYLVTTLFHVNTTCKGRKERLLFYQTKGSRYRWTRKTKQNGKYKNLAIALLNFALFVAPRPKQELLRKLSKLQRLLFLSAK